MTGPFRVELRAGGACVMSGEFVFSGPHISEYAATHKADELNAAWSAAGGPALVEMLRRCEWGNRGVCCICGASTGNGHADDCALAAILAKHKGASRE